MDSHWHFRLSHGNIMVNYDCGIHKSIAYKNLKKLEAHLIDVFPGFLFNLDFRTPQLMISGSLTEDDIERIEAIIGKNKFFKPPSNTRANKPRSAFQEAFCRSWGRTQAIPLMVYERRSQPHIYN